MSEDLSLPQTTRLDSKSTEVAAVRLDPVGEGSQLKQNYMNGQAVVLENGFSQSPVKDSSLGKNCDGGKEIYVEDVENQKVKLNELNGSFSKSEQTPTNGDIDILSDASENSKTIRVDKRLGDGDNCDKDGYDTHSDSIETLEEESPNEDIRDEDLSDSLVGQIRLTNEENACDVSSKRSSQHEIDSVGGDKIGGILSENATCDKGGECEEESDGTVNGASRPHSLSLPKLLQRHERSRSSSEVQFKPQKNVVKYQYDRERSQSEAIEIKSPRRRPEGIDSEDYLSKSLPHGTILRKGDMIEFVADDLQEKIRRSSPMSRTDSSTFSSRRSSLRSINSVSSSTSASTSMATSTASGMSRSPSSLFQQSPDDIPPIDPQAVIDLENQARLVADSVDLMMGNLRANLHKMSAISIGCLDAYRKSVDVTCDSVDGSIKSMYALMAKCEELSVTMQPIYQLAGQIKEIKRLLDLFEAQLTEKS